MTDYLRLIDWTTTGNRCDVTPLFADHEAFNGLSNDLIGQLDQSSFEAVAAVDALGFILGTALAVRMHKGLIAIRKGGKLPVQADVATFIDYTGQSKSLELRTDAVRTGMRVLLVDEWVETGAQVRSAISLIEMRKDVVAGVASIHIDTEAHRELQRRGYSCFTAVSV